MCSMASILYERQSNLRTHCIRHKFSSTPRITCFSCITNFPGRGPQKIMCYLTGQDISTAESQDTVPTNKKLKNEIVQSINTMTFIFISSLVVNLVEMCLWRRYFSMEIPQNMVELRSTTVVL